MPRLQDIVVLVYQGRQRRLAQALAHGIGTEPVQIALHNGLMVGQVIHRRRAGIIRHADDASSARLLAGLAVQFIFDGIKGAGLVG